MLTFFNRIIVSTVTFALRVCRLPGLNSSRLYGSLGAAWVQPLLERIGRRKALDVYRRARRLCPAYAKFLAAHNTPSVRRIGDFHLVPVTDKPGYVKKYSIEERCIGGRLPSRGIVIDESSGSSGTPNNWVRGVEERASIRRLLRHGIELTYGGRQLFLLNCFALGPWATGMNLSMSLADSVILKSIGPDKQKLENTLSQFGPGYTYAIAGYPPFMKDFLDTTALGLSGYELHLIVGGEGISEGLRDHFLKVFKTVRSSYGASDLEINIGAETPRSIALRRMAAADPALCRELFGRDEPPMCFQFNPIDYFVETIDENPPHGLAARGELVFTILRAGNTAPKVRYNIKDIGGVILHRNLLERLKNRGVSPSALPGGPAFPYLFVYGRSDLTVPFYGAKLYTTDIDAVLNADPHLREAFHSFQMQSGHDAQHNETLTLALEVTQGRAESGFSDTDLRETFYEQLSRVNQDFREVRKMFPSSRILIVQHTFAQGPFASRDIRVKNRYIAGV